MTSYEFEEISVENESLKKQIKALMANRTEIEKEQSQSAKVIEKLKIELSSAHEQLDSFKNIHEKQTGDFDVLCQGFTELENNSKKKIDELNTRIIELESEVQNTSAYRFYEEQMSQESNRSFSTAISNFSINQGNKTNNNLNSSIAEPMELILARSEIEELTKKYE